MVNDADQHNLNSNQSAWLLTFNNATSEKGCEWILDSGASTHMCADSEHVTNMRKPKTICVTAANNAKVPVEAVDDIYVEHTGPFGKSKLMLQNILNVPGISSN